MSDDFVCVCVFCSVIQEGDLCAAREVGCPFLFFLYAFFVGCRLPELLLNTK